MDKLIDLILEDLKKSLDQQIDEAVINLDQKYDTGMLFTICSIFNDPRFKQIQTLCGQVCQHLDQKYKAIDGEIVLKQQRCCLFLKESKKGQSQKSEQEESSMIQESVSEKEVKKTQKGKKEKIQDIEIEVSDEKKVKPVLKSPEIEDSEVSEEKPKRKITDLKPAKEDSDIEVSEEKPKKKQGIKPVKEQSDSIEDSYSSLSETSESVSSTTDSEAQQKLNQQEIDQHEIDIGDIYFQTLNFVDDNVRLKTYSLDIDNCNPFMLYAICQQICTQEEKGNKLYYANKLMRHMTSNYVMKNGQFVKKEK